MDLNAALILVRIVDKGSFTAAAQELGMTKATVSRRIADLEQHLGVRLLYRSTRQLTLTEAGEQYYLRCSKAVEELAQAELMLSASQQEVTGTLKLAVPIETGQLVVGRLVAKFLQAYPALQVELELTNRVVDPISEGLDAVVRIGDMSDSNLAARRLWSTERLLCASPDYLARRGAPRDLSEIASHDGLIGSSEHWRFTEAGREVALRPSGRWRCNSGAAVLDAALQGLGLCQLPDFYVAAALATGALASLLDEARPPDEGVWAVHPHPRHVPPKVRAMIDWLHDSLAPRSPA